VSTDHDFHLFDVLFAGAQMYWRRSLAVLVLIAFVSVCGVATNALWRVHNVVIEAGAVFVDLVIVYMVAGLMTHIAVHAFGFAWFHLPSDYHLDRRRFTTLYWRAP
jgi:hypothetical protein